MYTKTRIINVVSSTPSNELVHTKTSVENYTMLSDRILYPQGTVPPGTAPGLQEGGQTTPKEKEILNKKRSKKIQKKYERKKYAKLSLFKEFSRASSCA